MESGRRSPFLRMLGTAMIACTWLARSPACAAGEPPDPAVAVVSPGGRVRVELWVGAGEAASPPRALTYRVLLAGQELIGQSPMSVVLGDGRVLGVGTQLAATARREVKEEFEQPTGKRTHVECAFNEVTLSLREGSRAPGESAESWELVVRVADDGVALRYAFPKKAGEGLVISQERTEFRLPDTATATVLPLDSFTTSYERAYERCVASDLPVEKLLALPLLAEVPDAGCVAIAEADLVGYAGMYLVREADAPGEGALPRLVSRLSPRPDEPGIAVRAARPHESPWRVLLVADSPYELLESDFLLALNDPCALEDVSWIRPGKTTFPWWNAFVEPEASFEVGLNTQTMIHYIDFCAQAGIPYHTLDGKDDLAWYGGPISWKGDDPTTPVEGLDLPAVLDHARERGVGLRAWMHWRAAEAHMERAFPLYHEWGISGVMIDFMDRDDQDMIAFQRRLLELAADNSLTVVFHGVAKPTGLERTFPNLLGSEGVLNLEYNKWDPAGCTPDHQMICVFTRMLAGPMDFHQGGVRTVAADDYRPIWAAPLVIGTPCRTLASYVVFQNHLPMVADYPSAYASYPLLDALAAVPDTWDDTRSLAGAVGEYVVIARRSGSTWWVAAMTDSSPRRLEVPLAFLGAGRFNAELFEDGAPPGDSSIRSTLVIGPEASLLAALAPGGAWVARLEPAGAE